MMDKLGSSLLWTELLEESSIWGLLLDDGSGGLEWVFWAVDVDLRMEGCCTCRSA